MKNTVYEFNKTLEALVDDIPSDVRSHEQSQNFFSAIVEALSDRKLTFVEVRDIFYLLLKQSTSWLDFFNQYRYNILGILFGDNQYFLNAIDGMIKPDAIGTLPEMKLPELPELPEIKSPEIQSIPNLASSSSADIESKPKSVRDTGSSAALNLKAYESTQRLYLRTFNIADLQILAAKYKIDLANKRLKTDIIDALIESDIDFIPPKH